MSRGNLLHEDLACADESNWKQKYTKSFEQRSFNSFHEKSNLEPKMQLQSFSMIYTDINFMLKKLIISFLECKITDQDHPLGATLCSGNMSMC